MEAVTIKTCDGMRSYLRINGGLLPTDDKWDVMLAHLQELANAAVNHELDRLARIIHGAPTQ